MINVIHHFLNHYSVIKTSRKNDFYKSEELKFLQNL